MKINFILYFFLSITLITFNLCVIAGVERDVYVENPTNNTLIRHGASPGRTKICENHQENSDESLIERMLGGETVAERFFGNEKVCLQQAGLLIEDNINSDFLIRNNEVNQFYNQCIYDGYSVSPNEEIQELVNQTNDILGANHIQNRDSIINGFWQDLARRSQSQLVCRQRAIKLAHTNPVARTRLMASASSGFEQIIDNVRSIMLMKKASLRNNEAAVLEQFGGQGGCSGLAYIFCSDVIKARTERDSDIFERAIAEEISKLPYGHEIDVMESVIRMADTGTFDSEAYLNSLNLTFGKYENLANYYSDRFVVTDPENNKGLFCIDSEFKEFAAGSGVSHKLLTSLGRAGLMDSETANILNCRINSKYKEATENIDSFNNGLFLVGGGATALLTALPSGGGSLAAFATAASLGVSAASLSYQIGRAHKECTKQEFLISAQGGSEVCEPEKNFDKEIDKFSAGGCALEAGLAAIELIPIPFDLKNLVTASRGVRISRLMKDVEVRTGLSSADNTIVVSALSPGMPALARSFLSGGKYDNAVRSLGRRGIELDSTLSIEAATARSLNLEERAAVFEYMSYGNPLSRSQANDLENLFFSSGRSDAWNRNHRTNLERFLRGTGVNEADMSKAIDELLSSGILGNRVASRRLALVAQEATSVAPSQSSIARFRTEEEFVNSYLSRGLTTPEENRIFIDLAMNDGNVPGLFFVDSQNQLLKNLNDTIKDKPLIDALSNRHSELIDETLEAFKSRNSGVSIIPYSDYKGVRFAIQSNPPGAQGRLMSELRDLLDEADAKFMQELGQDKFTTLRGKIDAEQWFSTSIARTADEANVQARFKPGTTWEEINAVWLEVNSQRRRLENTLGGTTLMRAVPGSSARIPTEAVFAVLRKHSDPNDVRGILNLKFNTNISDVDAKDLIAYYDQIDFFSPGLMIDERVVHDFSDATFGVITGDIRNLGARNLAANAEGMSRGLTIEQSITRTRAAEQAITTQINEFKERSVNAIRSVLAENNIEVRVTVSGDDLVAVPRGPLTQEIKEEILLAQARAGVPSDMRVSFTAPNIDSPSSGALVAVEGEGIEKRIRASLELNESFSERELNDLIIAADMRGLKEGEGQVDLIINSGLRPGQIRVLRETLGSFTGSRAGNLRVAGAERVVRETAATFVNKPNIRFMRAGEEELPITDNIFTPGQGYVVIVHDNKLVIGENFVGANSDGTKGSHITLNRRLAGAENEKDYEGFGGAIRVNHDGSIDISGFHMASIIEDAQNNARAAQRIQALILEANPNAVTRITADRLSALD